MYCLLSLGHWCEISLRRLHEDSHVTLPLCDSKQTASASIFGNYQSSAQFYVFVGVICMLYCTAALVLYTLFNEAYRSNDRIPKYVSAYLSGRRD